MDTRRVIGNRETVHGLGAQRRYAGQRREEKGRAEFHLEAEGEAPDPAATSEAPREPRRTAASDEIGSKIDVIA